MLFSRKAGACTNGAAHNEPGYELASNHIRKYSIALFTLPEETNTLAYYSGRVSNVL